MKKIKLVAIAVMMTFAVSMTAQLNVNVNIGTPPAWALSGYNDTRYYYLPDVESYYDVRTSRFIYLSGNRWVYRTYLPTRYRNYNLYKGHKVVMSSYRGNSPYIHFKDHKVKYSKAYRSYNQRDNRDGYRDPKNYKGDKRKDDYSRMENRPKPQLQRNGNDKSRDHDNDKHKKNNNKH